VTATIPVGNNPAGVAITPNGTYAYVTNYGSGTVSVINTATNTVTATISGFNTPNGVAAAPNGAYVYITNLNGTVSMTSTSNAITSPTPYPTASPSPSPTLPEFSTASLILVVICVLAVTICAVESAHKNQAELKLIPSQTTR
jgi:YVTN family beta-propeller protein